MRLLRTIANVGEISSGGRGVRNILRKFNGLINFRAFMPTLMPTFVSNAEDLPRTFVPNMF